MAGDLGEWATSEERYLQTEDDEDDEEGNLDGLGDHIQLLNSGGLNGVLNR